MSNKAGDLSLPEKIRSQLKLPVIAGPMFLVSGPELMIACARAGVIGSFPTLNARTPEILEEWMQRIDVATSQPGAAPCAPNLIVHPTNSRYEPDLEVILKHKPPMVIASVGNPKRVIDSVKPYGGVVFADVISIKHARRAVSHGVDGLILICAGAGGNTGSLSPFAFLDQVRQFFDGPVAIAGGLSNGRHIHLIEEMGADFAYMGTRFIATTESLAKDAYRQMIVDSDADDVLTTTEVTGIPANWLLKSLEQTGFLASKVKHQGNFTLDKEIEMLRAWRDIWGAGHGVGGISSVESVADVVAEMRRDYESAKRGDVARPGLRASLAA